MPIYTGALARSFLVLIALMPHAALSAENADEWREARKLADLPVALQKALGVGMNLLGVGIADSGEPFNASDAILPNVPSRRFILAGVAENRAVVAIEQGGIATRIMALTMEKSDGAWAERRVARLLGRPHSLKELLNAAKSTEDAKHDNASIQ